MGMGKKESGFRLRKQVWKPWKAACMLGTIRDKSGNTDGAKL